MRGFPGGVSGKESTPHVNPWLIHVNAWQKPLHYCKVISLQLIKINEQQQKKDSTCQCRRHKRHRLDPWVRKIPWGRQGNPYQYSCLENPVDRGARRQQSIGSQRVWSNLAYMLANVKCMNKMSMTKHASSGCWLLCNKLPQNWVEYKPFYYPCGFWRPRIQKATERAVLLCSISLGSQVEGLKQLGVTQMSGLELLGVGGSLLRRLLHLVSDWDSWGSGSPGIVNNGACMWLF